jgi:Sec-independent protein translocase protein TatA
MQVSIFQILVVVGVAFLLWGNVPRLMKDLGQGVREFQNSLSSKKDSSQTQSSSSTPAKDDPWADYKKRKDPMDEFR